MNIENVPNIYQLLNDDGIIISYQGSFHQEIIEEITDVINLRLSSEPETKNKNKYLTMFVELSQNILRYSADSLIDDQGKQVSNGLILVGTNKDTIFVLSGNPIDEANKKSVKEKLDKLTSYSKDQLNRLYKDQLRGANTIYDSDNAGLGLIDTVRKSDSVNYHLIDIEPGKTFFTLKVEYNL
ncbi:MAG: SiaB family protein kinase [Spirochaetales bacterium]|nr:SiaB family protein kinase [Spirochaetales bacterium]